MKTKLHRVGHYVRERLRDPAPLRKLRWKFRTKRVGDHRIVLAFPPGRKQVGAGVAQTILHPLSEVGRGGHFLCHHDVCRRLSEVA